MLTAERRAEPASSNDAALQIQRPEKVDGFERLIDHLASLRWGACTDVIRPSLFSVESCAGLEKLADRARHGLGVEVFDTIEQQLKELIRIRHPAKPIETTNLRCEMRAITGVRTSAEYGVWVYYPWSRRLVHLVNENEFIELRTNRNLYKITPAERDALAGKRVGIVGLSVGQSIALTMAMERSFGEIRLADFDVLDATNLNRLRSGVHQIGIAKTTIAAREIAELDPFLTVRCLAGAITEHNIEDFLADGADLDLVVEECDSIDVKFLVRERARARGIPVIMDTSDRGLLDIERFDLEPSRPLLHGLLGEVDYRQLGGLSFEEKVPYVLKLTGVETLSRRMRASLLEIDQTVVSWPQLAADVVLGGAVGAQTARRVLLGEDIPSGRHYIDVESCIEGKAAARICGSANARVASACYGKDYLQRVVGSLPKAQDAAELDRSLVERLVEAGSSAPSGGNTQPWRWAWGQRTLVLMQHRSEPEFLDFRGLASYAAMGAALENVDLFARASGLHASAVTLPFGPAEGIVAVVRFYEPTQDRAELRDPLAEQIFRRHTNRRVGERTALSKGVMDDIERAAHSVSGVRLHWVDDAPRLAELEGLLGRCQQVLLQHEATHAQMMSEISFDEDEEAGSTQGITVSSLELSAVDRAGLELCRDWDVIALNRQWGGGRGLRRLAEKTVQGASAMGLVSVAHYAAGDYLAGGRAMQRAWLAATRAQTGFQPLSALPYLYARQSAGGRFTIPLDMQEQLDAMWPLYCGVFDGAQQRSGVLLFRLAAVPPPTSRSGRGPLVDRLLWF